MRRCYPCCLKGCIWYAYQYNKIIQVWVLVTVLASVDALTDVLPFLGFLQHIRCLCLLSMPYFPLLMSYARCECLINLTNLCPISYHLIFLFLLLICLRFCSWVLNYLWEVGVLCFMTTWLSLFFLYLFQILINILFRLRFLLRYSTLLQLIERNITFQSSLQIFSLFQAQ